MKMIVIILIANLWLLLPVISSSAQTMEQYKIINTTLLAWHSCQSVEPHLIFHAYLQNGDWLEVRVSNAYESVIRKGSGEIVLPSADTLDNKAIQGTAKYCHRSPEVPDKEVGPDCNDIPLRIIIESASLEGEPLVKGLMLWASNQGVSIEESFITKIAKKEDLCE